MQYNARATAGLLKQQNIRSLICHLNQLQMEIFNDFGVGRRLHRFSMIGRCGLEFVFDLNFM